MTKIWIWVLTAVITVMLRGPDGPLLGVTNTPLPDLNCEFEVLFNTIGRILMQCHDGWCFVK